MSTLVRLPRALISLLASAIGALVVFEVLTLIGLSGYGVLIVSFAGGLVVGRVLGHDARRAALGALIPLALLAPQAVADTELTQILILAVAALGLNILTGWAGQLNLAQGIFVGLGAYTTAILGTDHGWPLLVTMPVAGVVAAVVGAVLGVIALRFAGLYLAMLTTSVALVAPVLLKHYGSLTGGTEGISVNPVELPASIASSISSAQFNYALALLVAIIAAALSWNILSRRTGRALWALRDSTPAAQGIGVDITRYKVLAFAMSSFWAGIAGSLYAITVGFINPDSFGLFYGIQFLIMIVLGGVSTIAGSFIGAALVYELMTQVQSVGIPVTVAGQTLALPQQAVAGIVLILLVILVPRGVTGLLYDTSAWASLRRPLHARRTRTRTRTTETGSQVDDERRPLSASKNVHPLN
jgi:branched-chain amino acid transport system permease protein